MLSIVSRSEWRHPDRPIVQFVTPYIFVADEPVYIAQFPPFTGYHMNEWPGVLIGGRFPIHIWLRQMMWGFEWFDTKKPLSLRRGDPWFYVRFEATDPSRPVRLVEAEWTPEMREYQKGVDLGRELHEPHVLAVQGRRAAPPEDAPQEKVAIVAARAGLSFGLSSCARLDHGHAADDRRPSPDAVEPRS